MKYQIRGAGKGAKGSSRVVNNDSGAWGRVTRLNDAWPRSEGETLLIRNSMEEAEEEETREEEEEEEREEDEVT